MSIPKDKQKDFIDYAKKVLGPTWKKYGCKKHELYQVFEKIVIGKQTIEQDKFIERLYVEDSFDISNFYKVTKENELEKTKSYEHQFGAYLIELRVLIEAV